MDLRFAFAPAKARGNLLAWYQQHKRPLPWRTLWARHADPYHVWVSEIMLQQTVIKAVLPVYQRFLERFPDVVTLAKATEEEVRQTVRGLGYYRRFRFLHQAAKFLTDDGARKPTWPTTFTGWKELPGIGDYTAAAISSIAFSCPAAVVDGNVERVFCRLLDIREAPNQPHLKRAFQKLANDFIDAKNPGDFNQAVMELGQTVCTPTSPDCKHCPLQSGCLAKERGSQALAPAAKLKPVFKDVSMRLVIGRQGDRIAVLPRPGTARFLSGTAGFLTAIARADGEATLDGWQAPDKLWRQAEVFGKVKHNITHHRIIAEVASVDLAKGTKLPDGSRWVLAAEVEEQLVSNLDRKAWHLFQRLTAPRSRRQL